MPSLSLADQQTLRTIGEEIIQSIAALCVKSVVWAIYLMLVFMTAKITMRDRRGRSAAFYAMFVVVLSMFLMDTAMFFIDINDAVKEVSYTLTSNSNLSLQDRLFLTYSLPYPVQSAMYAFMANLGDIIVVWRVFAFYSTSTRSGRWLLAFPIMLLATSFDAFNNEEGAAGDLIHPAFCRNIQLTSCFTTLATTGVAILMIPYKTWVYRRTIGHYLDESRRLAAECPHTTPSRVERVAVILIESGILYFLFYLQAVISDSGNIPALEHSTSSLTFAGTIWVYNQSHIVGIYPAMVVILVHSERSYIENVTMEIRSRSTRDIVS